MTIILTSTNFNNGNHIISALKTKLFTACFILDFESIDDSVRKIMETCLDNQIKFEIITRSKFPPEENELKHKHIHSFQHEKCLQLAKDMNSDINKTYIFYLDKNYELNLNGKINLTEPVYLISENIDDKILYNLRFVRLDYDLKLQTKLYHLNNFKEFEDIFKIPVLSSENISLTYKGKSETIIKLSKQYCASLMSADFVEIFDENKKFDSIIDTYDKITMNKIFTEDNLTKIISQNKSDKFVMTLFFFLNLQLLYGEFEEEMLSICIKMMKDLNCSFIIKQGLCWYYNYLFLKHYIEKDDEKLVITYYKECRRAQNRLETYLDVISFYLKKKEYKKIQPVYLKSLEVIQDKNSLFYDDSLLLHITYLSTLFGYYIDMDRKQILHNSVKLLNCETKHYENIFNNMHYYCIPMEKLGCTSYEYIIPKKDGYNNSSCCIIPLNEFLVNQLNMYFKTKNMNSVDDKAKYLINFRYVNYYVNPENGYCIPMAKNGVVNTLNSFALLDSSKRVMSDYFDWNGQVNLPKIIDSNITGLEDVRLFMFNNQLLFTATQKEYSHKIRVLYGKMNLSEMKVSTGFIMEPPTDTVCEKNWIPISLDGKLSFIYTYHPLTIGHLNAKHQLVIDRKIETPGLWKSMRGSSIPIINPHNKDELWMLVHMVEYSVPRKYYHCIIVLNSKTLEPIKYTIPMCFSWNGVEYALSLLIEDKDIFITYSRFDKESRIISIPLDKLEFITV